MSLCDVYVCLCLCLCVHVCICELSALPLKTYQQQPMERENISIQIIPKSIVMHMGLSTITSILLATNVVFEYVPFNASGHIRGAPVDPITASNGRGWVGNITWATFLAFAEQKDIYRSWDCALLMLWALWHM